MPIYYKAESLEKPVEIDVTGSPDGVYVRKNIQTVETDNGVKYLYDEAFLSLNEFEVYKKQQYENSVSESLNAFSLKRENEIIDNYTLQLMEEGSL